MKRATKHDLVRPAIAPGARVQFTKAETAFRDCIWVSDVAAAISRMTDREISKHMLDRYSAITTEQWRFPLEALPALTKATGDFRLLELIADRCGCRVLRGEEAILAEIGALMLQQNATSSRLDLIKSHVPEPVMQRLLEQALKRMTSGGGR